MAAFFVAFLLPLLLLLLLFAFRINLRQMLEKFTKIYSYVQANNFSDVVVVRACELGQRMSTPIFYCFLLPTPHPTLNDPQQQLLHAINHWVSAKTEKTRRWL